VDDLNVDILIVGGGLIGASLMLALANTRYRVALVDATPFSFRVQSNFDERSLALSPASVRILEMLNVWPLLAPDACPIETIHVSERFGFGHAQLRGDGQSPLGYVAEMQHINRALYQCLDLSQVFAPAQLVALDTAEGVATIQKDAEHFRIKAQLIVAADGSESSVRAFCGVTAQVKAFNQQAIVANIGLARSHHHIAYERFTLSGPLALLPMTGNRVSMVWALEPDEASRVMGLNDDDFLRELQRTFGYRLGRFKRVGLRVSYPLRQVICQEQVVGPVVFIGNAAHTLHPVAGQGFNLGLRDVAMLAQCISHQGLSPAMLAHYQQQRDRDQHSMIRLTDGLIQLFTSNIPGMAIARRAGLLALDQIPALKAILARYARGFAGIAPDLVCGIPLTENEHE